VSFLGILKAGCAYVPIDPEYPAERINFIIEDTNASKIIISQVLNKTISKKGIHVLGFDLLENYPDTRVNLEIKSSQLAYIIYTSGTTGLPKGVMVEHASLLNYVQFFKNKVELNNGDFIIQQASLAFDTSIEEIFPALIAGASIGIIKDGGRDIPSIVRYIESGKATVFTSTPLVIAEVNAQIRSIGRLKYLVSGGDVLFAKALDKFIGKVKILNGYGPTETTVAVIFKDINKIEDVPTIGKPIANTTVYILDAKGEICPIGIPGEIVIGGVQVTRGYHNKPELTEEKFIKDPHNPTQRLYKTGDLGRWTKDGEIEYLGRIDEQVKIRGYRIELGEIEATIEQSGLVEQSVVVAKQNKEGGKYLVAYVVSQNAATVSLTATAGAVGFEKEQAIAYLKEKLPEYMVPQVWVALEQMPLTQNGKIDKRALPEADFTQNNDYEAPQTEIEWQIAAIWEELLTLERVGVTQNFFELGGHSLLAMRVIAGVRKVLNKELTVKALFLHPTVRGLAQYVSSTQQEDGLPAIEVQERPEHIGLSYAQERLWFIDQLEGSQQYHIPAVIELEGDLDKEALEQSLRYVVERHEVLRTTIQQYEGQAWQQIESSTNWKLERVAKLSKQARAEFVDSYISKAFDLSKDYMLRAALVEISKQKYVLVTTMHHIASDGWSLGVIVRDLVEAYKQYHNKKEPNIAPLKVQYADYALWQQQHVSQTYLEQKLDYWQDKLSGQTPLEMPTDYPRQAIQSTRGALMSFEIDEKITKALRQLSSQQGTTLFMTMLAAFKVLLYRYTNQQSITVGTPTAGRQYKELEDMVGFFINTLALHDQIEEEATFNEFLQKVKTTTIEAYDHQEVPFEKIVDRVVSQRDLSRPPIFQVMFIMQNTPDVPELEMEGVKLKAGSYSSTTSKYELTYNILENSKATI
jgi:amino acid adenylation domain-containing protein